MLTSLLAAVVVMSGGPDDIMTMVPGKVNGYLMLPGKVVCEGEAKSLNWSPDNQYLVTIRSQFNINRRMAQKMIAPVDKPNAAANPADFDPVRNSVVVWSVADAKAIQVWSGRTFQDECDQVALVGSNLYMMVSQATAPTSPEDPGMRTTLLRCRLGSSVPQIVRTFDSSTFLRIAAVDQTSKALLLSGHSADQRILAVLNGAGLTVLPNRSEVPKGLADALATNSRAWIGEVNGDQMASFGAPVTAPATSIVEPSTSVEFKPQPTPKRADNDLRLLIKTFAPATREVSGSVRALVYEDPDKPSKAYGIIASGVGGRFALAADNSAVAYTQDNALIVREMIAIPLDVLKEARESAQRTATLSNAKQAGLAMIMYSADYDDNLPANLTTDQILPYIKNPDILNGFVYTFGGGKLTDIKDPASTELGYVTGPGGRAIIYGDGHVKWKSD